MHGPTLELLDGKAAVFERRGDLKSGLEWAQKCIDAFGEQPEVGMRWAANALGPR